MRVRPELSQATAPVTQLVAAIVNYAGTPKDILDVAGRIWPCLRIYYGHTHLRLIPSGEIDGKSVYVELG
jgi:hypothetical protein